MRSCTAELIAGSKKLCEQSRLLHQASKIIVSQSAQAVAHSLRIAGAHRPKTAPAQMEKL